MQYNDSIYLFASIRQKGLYLYNKHTNTVITFHNDSSHYINGLNIINGLYLGDDNKVNILTEKNIIQFNPITYNYAVYKVGYKDMILTNCMDMCETKSSYWFAFYGNGIAETDKQFRLKKQYSTLNGIANDAVYKIFSYRDSVIVASTNDGLVTIRTTNNTIKNYYSEDGLHASQFEQLCGYKDGKYIYAGGSNGFTIIDPSKFVINTTPPLFYYTNIKVQTKDGIRDIDTTNLGMQKLTIPDSWLQTTIYFTGINFSNPKRVAYQYRIQEKDANWIDNSSQNFITIMALKPGTYHLQVRAINEDGYRSTPKTLTLVFEPSVV